MMTILLIRGLSRQQGHWGEFAEVLTRRLKDSGVEANLVFEDLPGFGNRNQESSPSSIEKIAELLFSTLEQLHNKTGQKIHLLGISMGGMIALELAKRFPELCESLVMINSSVKPVSRIYQRLRPSAYSALFKAWFHPVMRESERQILNISSEKYAQDDALLDKWLRLRKKQPPSRTAAFKQIIAASKFQAPACPPLKKVLLIASKKDRVASYKCTENLAKYWSIKSIVHESAGHDLALDEPEWLANIIVDWIA